MTVEVSVQRGFRSNVETIRPGFHRGRIEMPLLMETRFRVGWSKAYPRER